MDQLQDCIAKYKESENILENEFKNDPETDPYRSMHKALHMLLDCKDTVIKQLENLNSTDPEFHLFQVALSTSLAQIGIIYLNTKEFSKAEEYLMDSLASISDQLHPDYILKSVQVKNSLGYLWSHRFEHTESMKWLEEAEKLYKDFRNCKDKVAREFGSILDNETSDKGEKQLEKAHTLTKFYIAQVYKALKNPLMSAIYCHETLKRELVYNEYDPIDWALDAAILSKVFMDRILFQKARHHLAAASCVLDNYEKTMQNMQGSQEEIDEKKEKFRHISAFLSRFWAKYGIFLLHHSKNQEDNEVQNTWEEKNDDLENLRFDSLDLSLYENQIVDYDVVTFEDARKVFLIAQKHLNKAKEFYTLEERASDHVRIVQDHTQLFAYLAAFEEDEERHFKMLKKRAKMLEVIIKELNPKYYLDACRQLWFELGETYYNMMNLKFLKVKNSNGLPQARLLMQLNSLIETSIAYFNCFLDSLRDKNSKELTDSLPEELLRQTLVAHLYLGGLYHKYITQDKKVDMKNTKKSYECFKYVVDTCKKSEKAKSIADEKLNVSKEMMTLLQMKMIQL